jgi:HD-GYP domain-containing protein (c-di-GMP phosphodiesterase class II)
MNREVRWEPRRWVSRLMRVLIFVIPLILGVAAATIVARTLPEYDSFWSGLAWWVAVLATSFVTINLTDRLARKFLPLAALLDMSLVFPGAAPSRVKVALRSWTTAQLKARVQEAKERGIDDDPTRAGETVLILVAALNAHDRLTRGHAERTRAFTDVLAEELGVPAEEREKLRWVALLHDVGKLKISEEILNKEGKLDDDEWEAIKHHPQLGDDLIAPIRGFLGAWADTILHHHEKYDGTGYPQRLSGSEIAFGARIVAVADAFDAMTARRSYQPAMSPRHALREISENAESQFDPMVVRAFLNLSASRLRRVMGPLAVLAQLPFVAGFQRFAEWAGSFASGSVAVVAAVAAGIVGPISVVTPPPAPMAITTTTLAPTPTVAAAAPTTSTTLPPPTTTSATTTSTTTTTTTTTTTVPPTTTTTWPPPTTTTTMPPTTTTTTTSTVPPPTTTTTTTTTIPNTAPVAVNDKAFGDISSTIVIWVLDNDWDPDSDPLTIEPFETTDANGTAACDAFKCTFNRGSGSWSGGEIGFNYTINDGRGGTARGTFKVEEG